MNQSRSEVSRHQKTRLMAEMMKVETPAMVVDVKKKDSIQKVIAVLALT
jgi:hypothetical protein